VESNASSFLTRNESTSKGKTNEKKERKRETIEKYEKLNNKFKGPQHITYL
jgi:hypothetical protein